MQFEEIFIAYTDNHPCKMHSYWLLKQMVYIVPTRLQSVK
jgi:hypothetical protein